MRQWDRRRWLGQAEAALHGVTLNTRDRQKARAASEVTAAATSRARSPSLQGRPFPHSYPTAGQAFPESFGRASETALPSVLSSSGHWRGLMLLEARQRSAENRQEWLREFAAPLLDWLEYIGEFDQPALCERLA
jgi:hypothetical protein